MTICDVCTPWTARSFEELQHRLRTLRDPTVEFNKCPKCRSDEWATTDRFVIKHDRYRWWQFWREPPAIG
jgi:hypothetical protein